MSVQPSPDRPSRPWMAVAAAGVRGMAVGALLVALGCSAFAARGLHTGFLLADWLLGIALMVPPIGVFVLVVWLATLIAAGFLRLAARHVPDRPARVLTRAATVVRWAGQPLLGALLAVAWMVWFSPDEGPLAVFHTLFYFEILIVAGGLAGLLAGIGVAIYRTTPVGHLGRTTAAALLAMAVLGSAAVGTWAAFPGVGEPVVVEQNATIARGPLLDLPDPSQPGPYQVEVASYGSGTDARRPEYGAQVDWVTPTVDASDALPPRGFPAAEYARWFWGFDETRLPLNGLVWYPADATGRLPLALIAHGNHDAGDYSDPGYAYLGAHLASHGIVVASIDQNFLNGDSFFDYAGQEMGTRAWLLLRHAAQFATFDATPGHPLFGRIDVDRVALMGHSRGGEAAGVATMLTQRPQIQVAGLPQTPAGFTVRAVVAIAPSDTMYSGQGAPVALTDVDYLLLQGARDGDLPGYDGLAAYHRVHFEDGTDHLKAAVYSSRANHGRFNSIWDYGDAGPVSSWLLDRGALLAPAEQEQLARAVIGAFLSRSLLGQTGYDEFFREPRSGAEWLPDEVVQTHWQSSRRVPVDECAQLERDGVDLSQFTTAKVADVPLRDGLAQRDRACFLSWSGAATLTVPIPVDAQRLPWSDADVVFAMVNTLVSDAPIDPVITLRDAAGATATTRLSDVAPVRPLVPVQLWKLPGLGDRYAPDERHRWPAERFLQTYALPLSSFETTDAQLDRERLVSISFSFDQPGSVYLDDIGFEPGV